MRAASGALAFLAALLVLAAAGCGGDSARKPKAGPRGPSLETTVAKLGERAALNALASYAKEQADAAAARLGALPVPPGAPASPDAPPLTTEDRARMPVPRELTPEERKVRGEAQRDLSLWNGLLRHLLSADGRKGFSVKSHEIAQAPSGGDDPRRPVVEATSRLVLTTTDGTIARQVLTDELTFELTWIQRIFRSGPRGEDQASSWELRGCRLVAGGKRQPSSEAPAPGSTAAEGP